MTRSHRDYPTFVPATVDGEVIDHHETPQTPIAYQPMGNPIEPYNTQRGPLKRQETIKSTPVDYAHAFNIRTRQISIATGSVGAGLWFLIRWALPLTTGASTAGVLVVGAVSLVVGMLAFFAVWTGAYLVDMATSPGGISLFEAWRTQRRIDAQSAAMVAAYRKQQGLDQ